MDIVNPKKMNCNPQKSNSKYKIISMGTLLHLISKVHLKFVYSFNQILRRGYYNHLQYRDLRSHGVLATYGNHP